MSTENVASSNPEVGIRSRSFSLLDLLVLVTLFGLIFHAYSISWIPSFEFVMAWIFTAVGGGIVFLRPKVSTTLVLFAFAVVGMGMFPNLAVGALPVLLISIVAICSSSFVRSPRFFFGALAVCVLCGIYWSSFDPPYRLRRLWEAREKFPVMDLSDRLDYELADREQGTQTVELAKKVELALADDEQWFSEFSSYRRRRLSQLHSAKYEDFVRSIGFGAVRMVSLSAEQLSVADLPFITHQNQIDEQQTDQKGAQWEKYILRSLEERPIYRIEGEPAGASLHWYGRNDFLLPDAIGVGSLQESVGFEPHAIHVPIGQLEYGIQADNQAKHIFRNWQMERLELISLLRFDKPKAYVLEHLPRMDHLSSADIPTRDLNAFEKTALEKLRTDEDIVTRQTGDQLMMLGSLRASRNCMDCHAVKRGELLGAFSYRFRSTDPNLDANDVSRVESN